MFRSVDDMRHGQAMKRCAHVLSALKASTGVITLHCPELQGACLNSKLYDDFLGCN